MLQDHGHTVKLFRLAIVPDVVANPILLVRGWSRPDTHDCFAYVGQPANDTRGVGIEVPAPPGMLFVVFVLPDGTIDDWNWREPSDDDPLLPKDLTGDVLWQRQRT